jgi:hypothetical protein
MSPRQNIIPEIVLTGIAVFATVIEAADPFTQVKSKKGLQVQMTDDALALGIKHATLNVNLSHFIDPQATSPAPHLIKWQHHVRHYFFQRAAVEQLDNQIKSLSDHDVRVYLILLVYQHSDARVNQILSHPDYDKAAPNRLAAFNSVSDEGRGWLAAIASFFADRWSSSTKTAESLPHGRVAGYIVGNEVNSHWFWSNQGEVSQETFANDYHKSVRLIHTAVRSSATWPRVYISLEHHWNIRYPGATSKQAFPGRAFINRFAEIAEMEGDFDWHVAFHPYPEDLFDPRFWQDESAIDDFDTSRITFRNIDVLTRYLQQEHLLFNGKVRRVILSEQGFHTPDEPDGERIQAAAYCLAYRIVDRIDGIDAFILHRHVDHRHEGGLRLGLWTRKNESVSTPAARKQIYKCFRDADTDRWRSTFQFALPIIGKSTWDE